MVEEPGIWEGILREAASAARVPDSTVLLLGRPGIGKRTLMNALLQHASPVAAAALAEDNSLEGHSRAVAVDYAYFGARDPSLGEAEVSAHDFACPAACSVVILEDLRHEKLLLARLLSRSLRQTAAIVCVDLREPWTIMADLRQWLDLLQRTTSELLQQLSLGEQDELRKRVADAVDGYVEPGAQGVTADAARDASESSVTYNLGIPLLIVVTRSDSASALEVQKKIGWAETIETYLRSAGVPYGASLIYTSVKARNSLNVDVLYDYLMHRLYAFPLHRKATVPSRDALFLPSGWDRQDKLDDRPLQRSFESVVTPPHQPAAPSEDPEECEGTEAFLARCAGLLQSMGIAGSVPAVTGLAAAGEVAAAAPRARPVIAESAAPVPNPQRSSGHRRQSAGTGGPGGSEAPGDNSSLANFFQNLLTRGSAPPVKGSGGQQQAAARSPSNEGKREASPAGDGTPAPVVAQTSAPRPSSAAPDRQSISTVPHSKPERAASESRTASKTVASTAALPAAPRPSGSSAPAPAPAEPSAVEASPVEPGAGTSIDSGKPAG
mmetsp:Transcript_61686/g.133642  ORF Transcript_61686/g.133642 Transcript_61686/m.133642 type:complete len:553 (-) Transcript_61686:7-1665(-)